MNQHQTAKPERPVIITIRVGREHRERLKTLVAAEGLRRGDLAYSLQRFCREALDGWEAELVERLGMPAEQFLDKLLASFGRDDDGATGSRPEEN